MRAPSSGCVRMIFHSESVSGPGLVQHAVGDPDLADVVHGARVADEVGLVRRQPGGEGEPLGHLADALEVLARLVVAALGGLREPVHDLELGVAQLGGARVDLLAQLRR